MCGILAASGQMVCEDLAGSLPLEADTVTQPKFKLAFIEMVLQMLLTSPPSPFGTNHLLSMEQTPTAEETPSGCNFHCRTATAVGAHWTASC